MIRIWRKEYWKNIKAHLFAAIQICFVFSMLNLEIISIMQEYEIAVFAEETDSNLYMYENCMECLSENYVDAQAFQEIADQILAMDGVEELGYQIGIRCEIEDFAAGMEFSDEMEEDIYTEISMFCMNSLLANGIRYRLKAGSWFGESGSELLEIIIGGNLSREYGVGDTVMLSLEGEEVEALIVGDLGYHPYIYSFDSMGSIQNLSLYAYQYDNVILTADESFLERMEEENMAIYPSMSLMVRLADGAISESYCDYGQMTSIDRLAENSRSELKEFFSNTVTVSLIWLGVILFGIAGTTYLIARKRRYALSLYALMGVSGRGLMALSLSQNLVSYLIGILAARVWVYRSLSSYVVYQGEWTVYNTLATALLLVFLTGATWLCTRYIYHVEPKEILTQTKE